ncbi:hypothetical protein [Sphingosinicella rhizophila]|uniref:Lipoprotein n=1 Tax=Sphingosinicella rhizophila TaxID=3050082 RepID=A0ABU3Q6K8_9SPHN|nr:hypothetical protein [Sphingosinicella sp. GR2756]MDT9599041.1 hypothetical protein [Sphingosinicella sp. GR2756]
MRQSLLLFGLLLVAGCGEPIRDDHFANDEMAAAPIREQAVAEAVPVRIGELGPSFDACAAAGTTRHVAEGTTLPVRAAPFDTAAQTAEIASAQRFFVCARTLDQKWFGIVFDAEGALPSRCGVAAPTPSPRPYAGPCQSGWVASAFVKLVAGNDVPPATVVENGAVQGQ